MVANCRGEPHVLLVRLSRAGTAALSAAARLFPAAVCLLAGMAEACTIGVFAPSATPGGRAMLWKNRDNDSPDQEMAVLTGPRFRFVTNINAGDTSNAWAGVNEAGFAIIDANSFNLGGDEVDDDDGTIMKTALGSCATVEDFALMLDSLNTVGRSTPVNFGVIDSSGAAGIFEAGDTFYTRYDADDESLGFLLRANYSMSGGSSNRLGRNRWRRAMQLAVPARQAESIDARFIIQTLARDLGQVGFDPYPLPFDTNYGSLPWGYLPTDSTICRYRTRSVEVVVGPMPGGSLNQLMMWVMLGPGEVALPVPVWIIAESVPELLDGPRHALLCDKALSVHECLHPEPGHVNAVNTYRLSEMYDTFASVEAALFAMVESCEKNWGLPGPSPAQACSVTATACRMVMGAYQSFEHYTHWGNLPVPTADTWRGTQAHAPASTAPPGSAAHGEARVFDAAGREVARAQIGPGGSIRVIPPGRLRSGSYFVRHDRGGIRPARLSIVH